MTFRPMRFATQSGSAANGQAWIDRARRLEMLGYGTLAMPDHMIGGAWAAMPALAVAAAVAPKLRVGTLVIDNDFRNPTVFARECATLDVLTNGRFELGIGAGWLDRDYESTGIHFDRGRVRVARLAEAVTLMKRLFTEEQVTFAGTYYTVEKAEVRPKTVQEPHPPLLIAGGGPDILALAGREADIVAIVPPGITGSGKIPPESFTLDTMREQIGIVRAAAGERFGEIELSMFLDCNLTDDRDKTVAEIAEKGSSSPIPCVGTRTAGSGRCQRSATTSCVCATRSASRTSAYAVPMSRASDRSWVSSRAAMGRDRTPS
ncbi:MAG TPA: TIGR03621 family F420-dependent LLM class oxidoreductase [Candidatus Limnocylindria bacterium]|nr:TIGR03621 family F420-dependent LLM class oxidoreductase [Candidatus Limnocylindria bacterium]